MRARHRTEEVVQHLGQTLLALREATDKIAARQKAEDEVWREYMSVSDAQLTLLHEQEAERMRWQTQYRERAEQQRFERERSAVRKLSPNSTRSFREGSPVQSGFRELQVGLERLHGALEHIEEVCLCSRACSLLNSPNDACVFAYSPRRSGAT